MKTIRVRKQKKVKIDVLFLMQKPEGNLPCNVFAYFPNENYYSEGNIGYGGVTAENWQDMKTCYAHIGQHSSCHVDYAKKCRQAYYKEYMNLLQELYNIGYDCNILNDHEFEFHREPTEYEIKFGHGATHYRMFTASQIGINKKGLLKTIFKSKDDNLFYSGR